MKKSAKFLRLLQRYKCGLRAYITLKGDVTIRTHDNRELAHVHRDGAGGTFAEITADRRHVTAVYASPDESPRDCWRHVVARVQALVPANVIKPLGRGEDVRSLLGLTHEELSIVGGLASKAKSFHVAVFGTLDELIFDALSSNLDVARN